MTQDTVPSAAEKAAEDEAKEYARVAKMTDAEVMVATGHGKFGPGIVGKALAERSRKLVAASGGGIFGPAIMDPDYAKKQAAKRAAERGEDAPAPKPKAAPVMDDDDLEDNEEVAALAAAAMGGASTSTLLDMARASTGDLKGPWSAPDDNDDDEPDSGSTGRDLGVGEVPKGVDPMDLSNSTNPWTYVTLSGAKMLAQKHQVSHVPRISRVNLIAALQEAGVVPPPVPDDAE